MTDLSDVLNKVASSWMKFFIRLFSTAFVGDVFLMNVGVLAS
jgi:hypothetical protein